MRPLVTPPALVRVAQIPPRELLNAVPLQVQKGRQGQLRPALDRRELLEPILRETQRRFELLEKQFDLPANRVQLDHVAHIQPKVVRHQDFHVVRAGSFQILFRCRKDEPGFSDGVHLPPFLVDVVRPDFRFRPDPVRRQAPVAPSATRPARPGARLRKTQIRCCGRCQRTSRQDAVGRRLPSDASCVTVLPSAACVRLEIAERHPIPVFRARPELPTAILTRANGTLHLAGLRILAAAAVDVSGARAFSENGGIPTQLRLPATPTCLWGSTVAYGCTVRGCATRPNLRRCAPPPQARAREMLRMR